MQQKILSFSLSVFLLGLVASVAYALSITEEDRLTASDATVGDQLGSAVDIHGDTIVSTAAGAAPSGAGYVFVRSGTTWTEQARLDPTDPETGSFYGLSCAVWGDTAAIGSPLTDAGSIMDGGALYVFVRSGTTWSQQQKITASDAASLQSYGYSMDLEGDTLVAGSRWNNHSGLTNAGAVYVYTRTGTVWTEQQKVTASDAENYDTFGFAVALSGETMVVGAWLVDLAGGRADAGAAYVYVRSGGVWTEQQKLTMDDALLGDEAGTAVAIDGDTILVGAPGADRGSDMDVGALYAFTRTGTTWTQQAKLQPASAPAGVRIGMSVGFDDEVAIGGAPNATVGTFVNAGAAYVFSRSGTVWTEQGRIEPSMPEAQGTFGYTGAYNGTTAAIGAPAEAVTTSLGYLYVERVSGTVVMDGGVADAGHDAGAMDLGATDLGATDLGATDAGLPDAGDASVLDGAIDDMVLADASMDDASTDDAGEDAGTVDDAGQDDDAGEDAGTVDEDAGLADAGMVDVDSGMPVVIDDGGCGCRVAGSSPTRNASAIAWIALASMALFFWRRRRSLKR